MKIHIDIKQCTGCEACVNHCPEVFMLWGRYMKTDFDVAHPEKYRQSVLEAAVLCPNRAIQVE